MHHVTSANNMTGWSYNYKGLELGWWVSSHIPGMFTIEELQILGCYAL
jgi:hypothetical protein